MDISQNYHMDVKGKERLVWVDFIKGTLMLLIMWSHSDTYVSSIGRYLTAAYIATYFFLSGYLYKDSDTFGSFLKKKAKRCLLPYAVYGVILTVIYILINSLNLKDIIKVLLGLIYCRSTIFTQGEHLVHLLTSFTSVLWFFPALFLSYMFTYLFFSCRQKKIAFIMLLIAHVIFSFCPILLPWSLDTVPLFTMLMIGGCYFKKQKYFASNQHYEICGIAICLLIYFGLVNYFPNINLSIRGYSVYGLLGSLVAIIICFTGSILWMWGGYFICRKREYIAIIRGISYIGKHSITFMCTHRFVLEITQKILVITSCPDLIAAVIGLALAVIIGLVLCELFKWFYDDKRITLFLYL